MSFHRFFWQVRAASLFSNQLLLPHWYLAWAESGWQIYLSSFSSCYDCTFPLFVSSNPLTCPMLHLYGLLQILSFPSHYEVDHPPPTKTPNNNPPLFLFLIWPFL